MWSTRRHECSHARPPASSELKLWRRHTCAERLVRSVYCVARVTLYKPTTTVCKTCQGLNHKAIVCKRKPGCSDCRCIEQEGHMCERVHCASCHSHKHLTINPSCPAKIKADQMLKNKATRNRKPKQERARSLSTNKKTPESRHVRIKEFPALCGVSQHYRSGSRCNSTNKKPAQRPTSKSLWELAAEENKPERNVKGYLYLPFCQGIRTPTLSRNLRVTTRDNSEMRPWRGELKAIDATVKRKEGKLALPRARTF